MKAKTPSRPLPEPQAGAPRKRIVLVDDHPMMRAGLAGYIDRLPDLEVGGEAGCPAEAKRLLAKSLPDLLLTDLNMPGGGGTEFIKDLLAVYPGLPILVLSMHDEEIYGERSLRAGARGYLMKDATPETVVQAIRQVLRGEVYVSPKMQAKILEAVTGRRPRGSASPIEKLSDREFEVFQLIGQGKSTRDIASDLHISPKTVDVHRAHIKEKLQLLDVTSLIRHAVRWVETEQQEH